MCLSIHIWGGGVISGSLAGKYMEIPNMKRSSFEEMNSFHNTLHGVSRLNLPFLSETVVKVVPCKSPWIDPHMRVLFS